MKRLKLCLAIACTLLLGLFQARADITGPKAKKNPPFVYIRTNLAEPISVSAEMPILDKVRINIALRHRPQQLSWIEDNRANIALVEYRYYTSPFYIEKNRQRSYFAAPYLMYSSRNDEYDLVVENGKRKYPFRKITDRKLILGGIVGYQLNLSNRLSLDFFTGGGLSIVRNKSQYTFDNIRLSSSTTAYDFRLGLSIGFWLD